MYGLTGLYDQGDLGAGQTVAVYELEPYSADDIATYQDCYGTSAPVGNVSVDGGAGVGYGEGEAALDIEDVIGLAPKARINVYEGPNSYAGAYDTYAAIMAQDTARVISVSWGRCEAYSGSTLMNAENVLFEQAAIQGQTVLVASGDAGSEGCSQADGSDNSLSVDDPASQPFVTSVGGTKIVNPATPPGEVVWNEPSHGASGGGISEMWAAPAYQQTYLGATGGRSSRRGRRCRPEHRLHGLLRRLLDGLRRHQCRRAVVGGHHGADERELFDAGRLRQPGALPRVLISGPRHGGL